MDEGTMRAVVAGSLVFAGGFAGWYNRRRLSKQNKQNPQLSGTNEQQGEG